VTTTATPQPWPEERPGDPRPAFERVAATWLAREVDGGQRLNPGELAAEVSVTPRTAAATLAALRASRERDPGCGRVRMLLVRDRIQAAFVAAELRGDCRLDAATLAREAGVTTSVARQWLRTFRAARHSDPTLAGLRGEPAEHRPATRDQLAGLQAAYAGGGRPQVEARPSGGRALERIEQLYRAHEQARGRRLDPAVVARQVGVGRAYVAQTLAALRGGALTTGERVEQLWRAVERDGGHYLAETDAARMLNLRPAHVRQELGRLRNGERKPAPVAARDGGRLAWISQAACRDEDPELFFPERGHARQGTKAKQVCAACPVQGPCRDLAVRAASGRNEDHGIFGGTKPHERTGLRDNVPFDHRKEWLGDRAAAERAHQLAVEVGPQQAAKQLGTYPSTLRRAWERWGLDYPARPRTSPYARDREHAQRAFRLAEELGSIPAAAQQLGASRPALRAGWQRFGLGTPDTARVRQVRHAPRVARLDAAFLALNPTTLKVRTAGPAELAARMRRAEQEATLGYRVTTELTAENRWRTRHLRVWVVRQRAHHAHQRAHARERPTGRDRSTPERSPSRPGRDGDQEADQPGEPARRRAERERDRGGSER
jgi:WhiB family transcriptional regulator, redox-sensing transcriptional regulator